MAIVILRTVNFAKLSTAFGGKADRLSSIQRFMSDYDLDFSLVARLILKLLPHKGLYTLSMDRTNWVYLVGIFKDRFIKPIRTLNNGRMAFSFFKYDLDTIVSLLLNTDKQINIYI